MLQFIGGIRLSTLLRKLIARNTLKSRVDCAATSDLTKRRSQIFWNVFQVVMKEGRQDKTKLMITFAAQKGDTMKQRFHCIWENHNMGKTKRTNSRK